MFVRAKHTETGHLAALPKRAVEMGMCPGWVAVNGRVPSGPKPAAFPRGKKDDGEQQPPETADDSSAEENKE